MNQSKQNENRKQKTIKETITDYILYYKLSKDHLTEK